MTSRSIILSATLALAVVAAAHHWKTIHTLPRLEAENARRLADAAEQRRLCDESTQKVAAAQSELQAVIAQRMSRSASTSPPAINASPANAAANPTPVVRKNSSVVAPPAPGVRRLQVQAFVSEQRLRYTELLNRLHFTPEKRQAFDRINAAWQQAMLDHSPADAGRQPAQQSRDAQLQELFGANHGQWIEANRNEPARAVVAQIVQHTFQSAGTLTTAQADELTFIVAQHRIPPSKQNSAGQQYDWDRIIAESHSLLADRQREAFITAIEYRRANDKMSALATKRAR